MTSVRADSTCIDSAAATAAAERLVTADKVNAIVGADCSGVTGAVLQNVARANGIVMVSPSATSPALSTAEDDGLFFRTAPSDAREGQVMTDIFIEEGIKSVALTYTNNDYGKGLADAFVSAFEAAGGEITVNISHEDGKADYSSEVGTLASAGGDILVVAGYLDQGGRGIIEGSMDTGAWDRFVLAGRHDRRQHPDNRRCVERLIRSGRGYGQRGLLLRMRKWRQRLVSTAHPRSHQRAMTRRL